jgi:Flp pilus assembly protein TadD
MAQKLAGREGDAVGSLRRALALNAGDGQMLNNLAWLLATREGGSREERAEAVELARRATGLNAGAHRFRGTLAVALMAVGSREEGRAEASRAIEMARKAGDGEAVRELEKRFVGF